MKGQWLSLSKRASVCHFMVQRENQPRGWLRSACNRVWSHRSMLEGRVVRSCDLCLAAIETARIEGRTP
jgi:hypothetical protein